jgi:hypothetical protein
MQMSSNEIPDLLVPMFPLLKMTAASAFQPNPMKSSV